MFRRLLYIFILAISFINVDAQQFEFEHSSCHIYVLDNNHKEIQKLSADLLKEKRYIIKQMSDNKRILPGELYLEIISSKEKKRIFPACIIETKLKISKGSRVSTQDTVLYSKKVKRSVPRVTQKGIERCTRALRDTFVHIPYCKSIGYAGERK